MAGVDRVVHRRAREWLAWEPGIQLAEGLVSTVGYFRERLRLDRPTRRSEERVRQA